MREPAARVPLPRLDPSREIEDPIDDAIDASIGIAGFGSEVEATLDWAVSTSEATRIGTAASSTVWQLLAATAFIDVGAARILEPHIDALRILHEAGDGDLSAIGADPRATWGVFAAEGSGVRVEARETPTGWVLTGTKPWCSLARSVSHALVTAWVDDERRGLFAVALRDPGVTCHDGPWHARGLAQVVSAPVDFREAPAVPVGEPGWYLARRGFAAGGIGVAAAWWGGACGLVGSLRTAASSNRADQLALLHLGVADTALWAARSSLREAADLMKQPDSTGGALVAARVRTIVAEACERVVGATEHGLGPSPLVADEPHARRVADLQLYLRQHHAERDSVRVGRDLVRGGASW